MCLVVNKISVGGGKVSEEKMKQLVELLTGLKRYEWNRISTAVEKVYASKSNKIELDNEAVKNQLELEFKGIM